MSNIINTQRRNRSICFRENYSQSELTLHNEGCIQNVLFTMRADYSQWGLTTHNEGWLLTIRADYSQWGLTTHNEGWLLTMRADYSQWGLSYSHWGLTYYNEGWHQIATPMPSGLFTRKRLGCYSLSFARDDPRRSFTPSCYILSWSSNKRPMLQAVPTIVREQPHTDECIDLRDVLVIRLHPI